MCWCCDWLWCVESIDAVWLVCDAEVGGTGGDTCGIIELDGGNFIGDVNDDDKLSELLFVFISGKMLLRLKLGTWWVEERLLLFNEEVDEDELRFDCCNELTLKLGAVGWKLMLIELFWDWDCGRNNAEESVLFEVLLPPLVLLLDPSVLELEECSVCRDWFWLVAVGK